MVGRIASDCEGCGHDHSHDSHRHGHDHSHGHDHYGQRSPKVMNEMDQKLLAMNV